MPSVRYLDAALAQETDEIHLALLTVTHPDFAALEIEAPEYGISNGAIRLVANGESVTSRGNVYTAAGFELTLPPQGEGEKPVMSVRIENIDRRLTALLRTLTSPPVFSVEVVLASDPDTVEEALPDFRLVECDGDALEISLQLAHPDDERELVCSYVFDPFNAPALF
ncbi:MAG: DUF1833 family protein [Caulobacterales bacterium]|uniref:DUF1833 family protein n=1 Tax=Glycocaulis sp. TaxID=1969725 RepID=UPI003F9EC807